MSRNTKNLLTILIVAIVFCILGVAAAIGGVGLVADKFKDNVATSPEKVKAMANAFIQYELPTDYSETMGFDFIVYKMILISSQNVKTSVKPIIFLASFTQTKEMTSEKITDEMQRSLEQQNGQKGVQFKIVETRDITIDGQDTNLIISEGQSSAGKAQRQWLTTFPGKSGMIVLMIQGAISEWDDAVFNEFLSSLVTK